MGCKQFSCKITDLQATDEYYFATFRKLLPDINMHGADKKVQATMDVAMILDAIPYLVART